MTNDTLSRRRLIMSLLGGLLVAAAMAALVPATLTAQPAPVQQTRGDRESDWSFVLFHRGDDHTMDGSRADLERAEALRHGNERLLWGRRNGREYVCRDASVLDPIATAWRPTRPAGAQPSQPAVSDTGRLTETLRLIDAAIASGALKPIR